MPPLGPDRMTEAQRRVVEEIATGPRGAVYGPFVPLLRSPELASRVQHLGAYLRFESVLPRRLREFAILITARQWTQQYSWFVHRPLAIEAGVLPALIGAVADGRKPEVLAPDEAIVWEFLSELHATHEVGEKLYERARDAFGEQGVIELTVLHGYYTMLDMVLNVAGTQLPAGAQPPLQPHPES